MREMCAFCFSEVSKSNISVIKANSFTIIAFGRLYFETISDVLVLIYVRAACFC